MLSEFGILAFAFSINSMLSLESIHVLLPGRRLYVFIYLDLAVLVPLPKDLYSASLNKLESTCMHILAKALNFIIILF